MNEFELIGRFFDRHAAARPDIVLGVGDDCALWQPEGTVAVATDMLVGGRHFFDDVDPRALGHKALAVNLSDLAAMGAEPRACTLGIALPQVDEAWLQAFAAGLHALAERHGCPLIGGDTTRGPLNACVTVLGVVPAEQALRRDAARVGDDVWVSGALGAAAWAVACRERGVVLAANHPARQRLDWPQPQLALGRALRGIAACAIDVSDGLSGDLGHVLERSGCGATLDWARIPVDAALSDCDQRERRALVLAGGDDYELLFTAPTARRSEIAALGERLGTALSRIGTITAAPGIALREPDGSIAGIETRGFDHFAAVAAAGKRRASGP